jgi:phosphoenolpyruvate---glycerone phosphotransferase subunit DhaL
MDVALARAWIAAITAAVTENADYLTQLDSAIGDADHGVNLRRGFTAVSAALESYEAATVGDVLVKTGSTLVSKVGGASGPLYGTAFRAMGKALPEATVDATAVGKALRAALEGVQKLGAAVPGEKTMVDAYEPAIAAFDAAVAGGGDLHAAAEAARQAAEEGMHATTPLQARKGRASYLGARSVGHQDPGATSTWLVFKALAEVTA